MQRVSRFIYWTPRIFGIAFVLFLALFSMDVFESASTLSEILIGLFMHNIPALILLIVVIISWKYELVGAIGFTLSGLLYITLTAIRMMPKWQIVLLSSLIIAGPAFLIGILFFINWKKKIKS